VVPKREQIRRQISKFKEKTLVPVSNLPPFKSDIHPTDLIHKIKGTERPRNISPKESPKGTKDSQRKGTLGNLNENIPNKERALQVVQEGSDPKSKVLMDKSAWFKMATFAKRVAMDPTVPSEVREEARQMMLIIGKGTTTINNC